jgi:ADP-ribosylglycohydrolase
MINVLVGTAVGDAVGMPFESMLCNNKQLVEWDGNSYGNSEYHELQAGQFTDDTQMSIMVAESLIANGFSPEDLSARYLEWIETGVARGYGRTTFMAVTNIKNGVHWSETGVPGSYGNGTAMRAAPFGVFFRNDLKALIESVKIDSAITHRSDEAEAGALAIALATYFIVNDDEEDLVAKIDEYLPDSDVKKKLIWVDSMVGSSATPQEILKKTGSRADVRMTVPAVMYCYLKFNNYQEAMETAIRAGGDTDTTAAIVGALFGAKLGLKGIPSHYLDCLEDKDKLIVLDSKLYTRNNVSYLNVAG